MNPETLDALDDSIKHWEDLASRADAPEFLEITSHECPLCHLYSNDDTERCKSACPVRAAVRAHGCRKTPWFDVRLALENWHDALIDDRIRKDARADFLKAARSQLNFLKALRPIGV